MRYGGATSYGESLDVGGAHVALVSPPEHKARLRRATGEQLPRNKSYLDARRLALGLVPMPSSATLVRMTEGRQILLADDDEQVQRAVTRVAEKLGYNVIHVTIGSDVVSRAIETKPELIVLDVTFPDADGRDILSALKADPRTSEIAVLVWSGDARDPESDRKIALGLGAEDYVEKTDAQTLLRKIKRILLRLDSGRKAPLHD